MATISPLQALADRLEATTQPPRGLGDPLEAILATRLDHLAVPLEVASAVLGEAIWLCANDRQAAAVWARGGTPYTPPEVAILRELYVAVPPEVWAQRLRLIHRAKREFQGKLDR